MLQSMNVVKRSSKVSPETNRPSSPSIFCLKFYLTPHDSSTIVKAEDFTTYLTKLNVSASTKLESDDSDIETKKVKVHYIKCVEKVVEKLNKPKVDKKMQLKKKERKKSTVSASNTTTKKRGRPRKVA